MRTIYWNVDTQYDFMRDDESFHGALPVPGAREIERNLELLTRDAREKSIIVVNTADWHTTESQEISDHPDFRTTFPPHCLRHTKGASYIPATRPDSPYCIDWLTFGTMEGASPDLWELQEKVRNGHREFIVYKDKFDAFAGNRYTDHLLSLLHPDRVVVYGVATNVCVDHAVRGLLSRNMQGMQVYVVSDAIKELPGRVDDVLNSWKAAGVHLVTTHEVIAHG